MRPLRCAVYTRKSTEDGLEQEFNSLDAQREACEAYILSQRHEGWTLVPDRYDDGGYSGGNMERPGLKALLENIEAGRVDVIVVYKVDRLTRSLADFAKIVERLDSKEASFVSVTQAFNTTTSMGRLTLNVLLSFAQFEREVTGERIRDKIAASKKKGMWMGGNVPMGYEAKDRKLVVKDEDAEVIRHIFRRYLELGNVSSLMHELRAQGVKTRRHTSASGRGFGGCFFSRGHLYAILGNRLYLGEIVHKGISHPGEHEAIVDQALWNEVQQTLASNHRAFKTDLRVDSPSFLKGLLYDSAGNRMSPSHGQKTNRRYRYYVSRALLEDRPNDAGIVARMPAHELELLVEREVLKALGEKETTRLRAGELSRLEEGPRRMALRDLIRKVIVEQNAVTVELRNTESQEEAIVITLPFTLQKRGGKSKLVTHGSQPAFVEGPRQVLISAIAKAWSWRRRLESGAVESITAIAKEEDVTITYVSRMLRFAYLAPDIIEAILDGTAPESFSGMALRNPLPLDWNEQRRAFGFGKIAA